jgi:hypothetical protein
MNEDDDPGLLGAIAVRRREIGNDKVILVFNVILKGGIIVHLLIYEGDEMEREEEVETAREEAHRGDSEEVDQTRIETVEEVLRGKIEVESSPRDNNLIEER